MRAFFNFYLVNFYGDVPLVLTTSPTVNAVCPDHLQDSVYEQIVTDLKEAQELLSDDYLKGDLQLPEHPKECVPLNGQPQRCWQEPICIENSMLMQRQRPVKLSVIPPCFLFR